MRGFVVVAASLLLLGVAWTAPVAAGTEAAQYVVGYSDGNRNAALLAIQAAGGEVQRVNGDLHFAVTTTDDAALFERSLRHHPGIDYVERDDVLRMTGAQWNGAQWNGAQWNGAQWNGAQWNGAQWNGAQWNGAQWNGAQWNGAQWNDKELQDVSDAQRQAAKWTEFHYQADTTNKMKWAGEATDPGMVWQWGSWATKANKAWTAGHVGTRTASVCVLDSGVWSQHPDIAPNFEAAYNAMDPSASAEDDGGHGTHVAGIAAGSLADAYGMAGAGNTRILSAKVLDASGAGHESDLAFGLVWCAKSGAKVGLMALSVTETDHPTLQRAIKYATQRDVLLMASAGNTGGSVEFPASHPSVTAVSAVDGNLTVAAFSSRGPQVDLAAPGVYVLGPYPADVHVFGSGTSQAVAYAAGVAALMRDVDPTLTAVQTKARLVDGARDLGDPGRDDATGAGLVQVDRAVIGR